MMQFESKNPIKQGLLIRALSLYILKRATHLGPRSSSLSDDSLSSYLLSALDLFIFWLAWMHFNWSFYCSSDKPKVLNRGMNFWNTRHFFFNFLTSSPLPANNPLLLWFLVSVEKNGHFFCKRLGSSSNATCRSIKLWWFINSNNKYEIPKQKH